MKIFIAMMMVAGFAWADEIKNVEQAPAPADASAKSSDVVKPEPLTLLSEDKNEGPRGSYGLMCRSVGKSGNLETCRASISVDSLKSKTEDFATVFENEPEEQFKFYPKSEDESAANLKPRWTFNFRGLSKQDAGFSLETKGADFEAMVFPRKVKPSAEINGDDLTVTLATGEKVVYDKTTAKIKSGVFSSKKDLQYTGTGVMVKVQNRENRSIRLPLDRPSKFGKTGKTVEITKPGFKTGKPCYANVSDLWDKNSSKEDGAHKETHFKYANDNDFDKWLKDHCGFGIEN